MGGISDWPSLYHLSPYRANLLRPFTPLIRGAVLEIGSGCGALTRFLGEQAATITGVEGSMRRARIAAERCADLSNVAIYCDNFEQFSIGQTFQLVTCIGVIEYSPLFFSGPDPFTGMLRRLGGCVASDGYLLIAIENRLGLSISRARRKITPGSRFNRSRTGIPDRRRSHSGRGNGRRPWRAPAWNW